MNPLIQDLPPKAGFPKLQDTRNLKRKGVPGIFLFGAVAALMTYGFVKVARHSRQRRYLASHARFYILADI